MSLKHTHILQYLHNASVLDVVMVLVNVVGSSLVVEDIDSFVGVFLLEVVSCVAEIFTNVLVLYVEHK